MYQRILLPLDGSRRAEQVLAWAEMLAQGMQSRLELLRVYEPIPPETRDILHGVYPYDLVLALREQAQEYLEGIALPLRQKGLSVSTIVQEGSPARCIIGEAEKEPDTLIAMTTHGRSGINRWLLGSVTDKALHATTNPLLVARAYDQEAPPEAVQLQTLMVPLDGSALAEQILPHAVALSKALALKVLLVRVTPSREEYHRYLSSTIYAGLYGEVSRGEDARALQYLQEVKERLTGQGVPCVEERLLKGHAADAIVELAGETPRSLVAMTTHGRSGVGRWLLGSVADRLVCQSGDLVLVVRAAEASDREFLLV